MSENKTLKEKANSLVSKLVKDKKSENKKLNMMNLVYEVPYEVQNIVSPYMFLGEREFSSLLLKEGLKVISRFEDHKQEYEYLEVFYLGKKNTLEGYLKMALEGELPNSFNPEKIRQASQFFELIEDHPRAYFDMVLFAETIRQVRDKSSRILDCDARHHVHYIEYIIGVVYQKPKEYEDLPSHILDEAKKIGNPNGRVYTGNDVEKITEVYSKGAEVARKIAQFYLDRDLRKHLI